MPHVCSTRSARGPATHAGVINDPDVLSGHLEDAAHYPGGHAAGIVYPRTEADVAAIVGERKSVLPIAAQSSLTGGATPFGEILLSTSRLNRILNITRDHATCEAGVPLSTLEEAVRQSVGATYPPKPTFTGASLGGVVATNAAGAATFKHGSTRDWVEALTVVLATGEVLDLHRGACVAWNGYFEINTGERLLRVPVPRYRMPAVAKRSAGYFAAPEMDLIDLFVGSEGTLGIITSVTVRLLSPAPAGALAVVFCPSEESGLRLADRIRTNSLETWRARDMNGIDVSAIEHLDRRSLEIVQEEGATATLNVAVPTDADMALLIQLDLPHGTTTHAAYEQIASAGSSTVDGPLLRFCRLIDEFGLLDATEFAAPGDQRRAGELLAFREAVPSAVNRRVGVAKRTIDPRIEKTAADMIVPFERFAEMMHIYRAGFSARGLDYAVWGHLSDGNVHPNVIPRSYADVEAGKDAILEFGRAVARLGGCPLAEHGVGRNPIKQSLLKQLYGEEGIEQMREVKRALDPEWKLAPGVIFERNAG